MLPARCPPQDTHRRRQHSCGSSAPSRSSAPYVERTYSYERDGLHNDKKQTLCGACGGAVVGIGALIGATILLFTNEGNAVAASLGMLEAEDHLSAGTGGIAHLSGMLRGGTGTLRDHDYDVEARSIWLERVAEVYQWKETGHTQKRKVPDGQGGQMTETTKTYTYAPEWVSSEIRSSTFEDGSKHNPSWSDALYSAGRSTGTPFAKQRWTQQVTLDGLRLTPQLLSQAESPVALGQPVYARDCGHGEPAIGCARLVWRHAPLVAVSVLARRTADGLEPWRSKGNAFELSLLMRGTHSAQQMFTTAANTNAAWKWGLRALGAIVVCAGWGLVLGPATHLASYVPILGGLVGCALSLVALCLASAQSLVVIGLAWLFFRPVFAATLLALGAAIAFGGYGSLRGAKKAKAKAEPPPEFAPPARSSSPAPPARSSSSGGALAEQLRELADLKASGALTEDEYTAAKAKAISRA